MRYAALVILLVGLIPASALAAPAVGTGGASVPPEPETGGARAVQPAPVLPSEPEPDTEAKPQLDAALERAMSPARSSAAAPGDEAELERAEAESAQDDGPDVEVPVPPMDDPPEPAPDPAPAEPSDDSEAVSLAQTGLEAAPLVLLGLALMVAGLTVLRLLTRRPR